MKKGMWTEDLKAEARWLEEHGFEYEERIEAWTKEISKNSIVRSMEIKFTFEIVVWPQEWNSSRWLSTINSEMRGLESKYDLRAAVGHELELDEARETPEEAIKSCMRVQEEYLQALLEECGNVLMAGEGVN